MKKIGIIGSGIVAQTLAKGYHQAGHPVKIGSRHPDKLNEWQQNDGSGIQTGSFNDAAEFGDVLILAIKGTVADKAIEMINRNNLSGKTIIDTTNPIAEAPPENGVLPFFTDQNGSLMEKLQAAYPEAKFVKAFNSIGSPFMVNPSFELKPTMFICGNDPNAKSEVKELVEKLGWDVEDMGSAESARAIEPLCMLWCIPGMLHNQWSHAFKLLKTR